MEFCSHRYLVYIIFCLDFDSNPYTEYYRSIISFLMLVLNHFFCRFSLILNLNFFTKSSNIRIASPFLIQHCKSLNHFYCISCLHFYMTISCPHFYMTIPCLHFYMTISCLHFYMTISCLHFYLWLYIFRKLTLVKVLYVLKKV